MRRDKHRRVRIESSNLETQPACEIGVGLTHWPLLLCRCSASSKSAHIQHRVDGRQRNQTGEAKIPVIHGALSKPRKLPCPRR